MKKFVTILIALFTVGCATRTKYVYVKVKPKETTTDTHTGGPESGQGGREAEGETGEKKQEKEEKKKGSTEKSESAKVPESESDDPPSSQPTPENNRRLIGAMLEELNETSSTQSKPEPRTPNQIEPRCSTVYNTVGADLGPDQIQINGIDTCNNAPVVCVQIEAVCPVQNPECKESGYRYVSVAGNAREYTVMTQGGDNTKLTCVSTAEVDDLFFTDLAAGQRVRIVWMRRTNTCEPQVKQCNRNAPRILEPIRAREYVSGQRPVHRAKFACH